MATASYNRRDSAGTVTYDVASAPLGAVGTERVIAMVQWAFASIFLGWAIAFVLFIPVAALRIPLSFTLVYVIGFALSFYGLYRWRGAKFKAKAGRVFGRRGNSKVVLSHDLVKVGMTSSDGSLENFEIPLRDVRRVRLNNTLRSATDIRKSDVATLGAALAQPTAGRAGVIIGSNEIGKARQTKAALTCFAVLLDYANTSITIADGLDELTATNLYDDVDRDIKVRTEPAVTLS